jgi:hypothetical protein
MDSAKTATATFSPLPPSRASGRLSGFFAVSGATHLYRFGRNVVYTGTVAPNRAGEPLWFQEQQKIGGVWKAAGAPFHYRLGAHGQTGVEFLARYLKLRRPYRVRCYYLGDAVTAPSSSSWSFFKEI